MCFGAGKVWKLTLKILEKCLNFTEKLFHLSVFYSFFFTKESVFTAESRGTDRKWAGWDKTAETCLIPNPFPSWCCYCLEEPGRLIRCIQFIYSNHQAFWRGRSSETNYSPADIDQKIPSLSVPQTFKCLQKTRHKVCKLLEKMEELQPDFRKTHTNNVSQTGFHKTHKEFQHSSVDQF